jgi:hypothetical protein
MPDSEARKYRDKSSQAAGVPNFRLRNQGHLDAERNSNFERDSIQTQHGGIYRTPIMGESLVFQQGGVVRADLA